MTDAVAVVIPAHNAAPLLGQALESLRRQTLPPSEVVVVDDGSKDDTAAVAERHGARVLRQANAGPAAARNHGIRSSSAPLVAFLDADDWFAPDKLARQVEALRRLDAAAVATDAWLVQGGEVGAAKNAGKDVPAQVSFATLLRGNPLICSTVLARRDALEQAGLFDEAPELIATEDYDLWLRLSRRQPIAYLDAPLAYYRVHPGSLTSNRRFLRGVDRIADKLAPAVAGDPHLCRLLRRRRADVRLDLAWDLLQPGGDRAAARELIREAQRQAPSWKGLRMWLRSLLRAA